MSMTMSSMLFKASLVLSVAWATSLTESQSHHAETQRILRVDSKGDVAPVFDNIVMTYNRPKMPLTVAERQAKLVESQERHAELVKQGSKHVHPILMTYKNHLTDFEQLEADIVAATAPKAPVIMTYVDDTVAGTAPTTQNVNAASARAPLLGHPPGPCLWLLQIARAERAGVPVIWRTVMVNGTKDDNFHFRGCTTLGEEGAYCKHTTGLDAGVRVLRNWNDAVVEFGSCCNPNIVDTIVKTRIQHCDNSPPAPVQAKAQVPANSSWMRTVSDLTHKVPWLQLGPSHLALEGLLFAGVLIMFLILCLMRRRDKK